jgi:hypothetical protein
MVPTYKKERLTRLERLKLAAEEVSSGRDSLKELLKFIK